MTEQEHGTMPDDDWEKICEIRTQLADYVPVCNEDIEYLIDLACDGWLAVEIEKSKH